MFEEEFAEDEEDDDKVPEEVFGVLSLLHANKKAENNKGKICFIK